MSLSRNVLKLLSGRVSVQILGFLTIPILTRLFSPEHFGVMQLFDSIVMLCIVVAAWRYEVAIPMANTSQEAFVGFTLSSLISLTMSLGMLGIVIMARHDLAGWYDIPQLAGFLWLAPLAVFLGSLRNNFSYWAAHRGMFGCIAWSELSLSCTDKFIPLLWGGLVTASATVLFVGRLAGFIVGVGVFAMLSARHLRADAPHVDQLIPQIISWAKHHRKFPLFNSWAVLLNAISVQVLPLFLGRYFSSTVLGYYSTADKVIGLPLVILGTSVAQAFFPAAAKEYRESGSLQALVVDMVRRLVQMCSFLFMTLIILGPDLFEIVFGTPWREAGVYAQILAGWGLFAFMNIALRVFEIFQRQEVDLLINIFMIIGRLGGLMLGAFFTSPRIVLALFVLVSVVILVGTIMWKLRLSQVSLRWAAHLLLQYILISCILLLPVKCLSWWNAHPFYILGGGGIVTLLYGVVLLYRDTSFRDDVHELLSSFNTL